MKIILLLATILAMQGHAQILQQILAPSPAAAPVTAGLVNFRGMPNNENSLGAKVSNGCATDAFCTWLVDPSLAGNTIIVFYEYASGTAQTPTISDDKTNTYTHCGTDAHQTTNNYFIGCFYKINAATSTRAITVTFPAGVSNVSASAAQVYNVTAVDVYTTNIGSAATTFTAGSATSTAANDLWFQFACGTSTINDVGAWTVGSQAGITWHADLADRRDACMVQRGIQTAAGALNPQLTTATSNNYAALGISFKSGSQGTAPSGMYIQHIYSVNSASTPPSTTLSYQMPVNGNLIAVQYSAGNVVNAISDATNGNWTSCGVAIINGGGQSTSGSWYFPNSASGLLNVSMTIPNTAQDVGAAVFYDIAGAATTQVCNRASPQAYSTATALSYTANSSWTPSSSSGIALFTMAQAFNTTTQITAPTGAVFDCDYAGGQSLNGPSYPDQNNGCGHLNFSSNTASAITWTESSATQQVQTQSSEMVAFQAPGATLGPMEVNHAANSTSSGTTVALTSFKPYQAGDLFAVITCGTVTGTQSISDGTNTYVSVDNQSTTSHNGVFCRTWYSTGSSGSTVTITSTQPSGTFHSIMLEEFANVTTLDQHNIVSSTASGSVYTGTAVTTTSANEAIFGAAFCDNCALSNANLPANGTSTQPWTQENTDGQGNVSGYYIVSATGSYHATFLDPPGVANAGATAIMTFH